MFKDVRISGSYYYDGAMERLEKLSVGEAVNLQRDPNNEYDANAVRVISADGIMMGYIAAGNGGNVIIANLIEAGQEIHAFVSKKTKTTTYLNVLTPGDATQIDENIPEAEEMNTGIITLVQIPIIEEKLISLSAEIEAKVQHAKSLVCNEETVKAVKDVRASLNKEFDSFEEQRKLIKLAIMEPYEAFEDVYKQHVATKYKEADKELAEKINATESELKGRKEAEVREYFDELAQSLNIGFITFEQINLKVNLSDSVKKLKEKVHKLLTKVSEDMKMIATLDEEMRSAVMVEFKNNGFNAANATITVTERNRRKREEAENIKRAEEQRRAEAERIAQARAAAGVAVKAPEVKTPAEVTQEKLFSLKFKVTATKAQLMELKTYLETGGYTYESIK
ncbi:MAG: DUF1351 domain-containing protein [Bacteroidales bacterium]|nr:DUF1351 domain-containing protein [Bacteroidales bacterium]